jgi:hypothetical protein
LARNPFSQPFHTWPDLWKQAHEDKPEWGGKVAPFTEEFRGRWREWAKKWKQQGLPLWPAMVDAYKQLDRKKTHV